MQTTLMGFSLNNKLIGIPAKRVESEFNQTSKLWKKPYGYYQSNLECGNSVPKEDSYYLANNMG